MTNSPAEVIQWLLIALGQGTIPTDAGAWPCHATNEPSQPDDCLTVYDTTGQSDGRSMIDGALWQHFGFQVRVRSKDHRLGWVKADAIRDALSLSTYHRSVSIPGDSGGPTATYHVWSVNKIGVILPLGTDQGRSKRSLFTLNAIAALRPTN